MTMISGRGRPPCKRQVTEFTRSLVGIVTQTDIVASTFDFVTSLKEMVRARYRPPDFQP